MWNAVERIAKDMFMPEAELIAFAEANEAKYSVDVKTKGDPWVSNWHSQALIDDFRAQNMELCERVYEEKVAAMKAANLISKQAKTR